MNTPVSEQSLFGFPFWLAAPWCLVAPGTAYLIARTLYEETILTWRQGPQMVLFSFTHADAGFALLCFASAALMALWLLTAIVWVAVTKRHDVTLERRVYWFMIGTAAGIALLFIPYSWLGGY